MWVLALIILLSLVGVLGDAIIKYSGADSSHTKWFILGFIVYASTAIGWFYAMKHIKLSSLGVIYALTTVVALTLVGVFYFKEKLTAPEMLGIVFAIASIVLLKKFA